MSKIEGVLILLFVAIFGAAVGWAGSDHGQMIELGFNLHLPVFALGVAIIFVIQLIAFVPAIIKQTEHFYDLVGGLSYLVFVGWVLLHRSHWDTRTLLLGSMMAIWALRLSIFLFLRVKQQGSDSRFDSIKGEPLRFLIAWAMQGLWIVVTAACGLAAMSAKEQVALSYFDSIAIVIWLAGLSIEVVADWQKRQFKQQTQKSTPFICSGLWRYSRHPNYLGEIILWIGVALLALPALSAWQHATLISPLFVILLLTQISGIPLLEAKADERWQLRKDYQHYKTTTPVLFFKLTKLRN